jgi:SAM-dependent methyltransferase
LDSKIEALLKKIVSICEINNSLIHADAIISNEKIYIIELAPRASGNKITELLLPLALGEEPLTRFIEFLMGNNSLYKSSTPLKPTIFHFIDFPEEQENKIITQINPLNNIQTLLYYKSDLRVGDRLHKITNGSEAFSNGYFILQGDPKAMHQDIKTIQKRFKTTTSIDVINKTNQKAWSNIINKNTLLYPDTPIVSFLARHFSNRQENKHKTALDIGFGSGRHLQLLKDYQFDIFGIDYSEESCKAAENLFKLQDNISCDDLSANPFKDKKFDVILSYGVIFLKPVDEMLKDLKIIHGSLKNKGKMIINFRTKDDFLYRDGEKIDDHTYILANPAYKDMCYTFLDKEEVIHLLDQSGFSLLNLSRVDYHKNNLTEHHSWWIAEVIKND